MHLYFNYDKQKFLLNIIHSCSLFKLIFVEKAEKIIHLYLPEILKKKKKNLYKLLIFFLFSDNFNVVIVKLS